MQLLKLVGSAWDMRKIMLTVLKGHTFFRSSYPSAHLPQLTATQSNFILTPGTFEVRLRIYALNLNIVDFLSMTRLRCTVKKKTLQRRGVQIIIFCPKH